MGSPLVDAVVAVPACGAMACTPPAAQHFMHQRLCTQRWSCFCCCRCRSCLPLRLLCMLRTCAAASASAASSSSASSERSFTCEQGTLCTLSPSEHSVPVHCVPLNSPSSVGILPEYGCPLPEIFQRGPSFGHPVRQQRSNCMLCSVHSVPCPPAWHCSPGSRRLCRPG